MCLETAPFEEREKYVRSVTDGRQLSVGQNGWIEPLKSSVQKALFEILDRKQAIIITLKNRPPLIGES